MTRLREPFSFLLSDYVLFYSQALVFSAKDRHKHSVLQKNCHCLPEKLKIAKSLWFARHSVRLHYENLEFKTRKRTNRGIELIGLHLQQLLASFLTNIYDYEIFMTNLRFEGTS